MSRVMRSMRVAAVLIWVNAAAAACTTVTRRPIPQPAPPQESGVETPVSPPVEPQPNAPHHSGTDRNFVLPAIEILITDGLLNIAGRHLYADGYNVTAQSI